MDCRVKCFVDGRAFGKWLTIHYGMESAAKEAVPGATADPRIPANHCDVAVEGLRVDASAGLIVQAAQLQGLSQDRSLPCLLLGCSRIVRSRGKCGLEMLAVTISLDVPERTLSARQRRPKSRTAVGYLPPCRGAMVSVECRRGPRSASGGANSSRFSAARRRGR
jgi:hypothetical protein